jgi:hypothetical protein
MNKLMAFTRALLAASPVLLGSLVLLALVYAACRYMPIRFSTEQSACFLVLMAFFIALAAYVTVDACHYQGRIADELRRDLGFDHGTRYIRDGRGLAGVLSIDSLDPSGIFEQAGFRVGDIIKGPSITGLYKMLHRGRGSRVQITVVEGGEGPPLKKRSERVISVKVPAKST